MSKKLKAAKDLFKLEITVSDWETEEKDIIDLVEGIERIDPLNLN